MAAKHRTKEQFVAKARESHNDVYDYSEADYINFKTVVSVRCREHGMFSITPWKHLSGTGCPACAARNRSQKQSLGFDGFVAKATEANGGKYTYPFCDYVNNRSIVKVICPTHGLFEQRAYNHLNGRGCRKCMETGFNISKPAKLYILVAEGMLKVGITNSDPRDRARRVKAGSGKLFNVAATWEFDLGRNALDTEMAVLAQLRTEFENPSPYFEGATECFVGADLSYVSSLVSQHI